MFIWKLESKDCLHWHCLRLETFGGEIRIQSLSVLQMYLESHYLFAYSDKEIPLAFELEFFQIWY